MALPLPARPALVIFDCDGVLVDSEVIASRVLGECLVAAGFPLGLEEAIAIGVGTHSGTLAAAIEARFGRALPDGFLIGMRAAVMRAFTGELKPVAGIVELLGALGLPCCVASNSHIDRVRHALGVTGLDGFFGAHVFSAAMVKAGKPAPDLFLFAAARMGVPPGDCLVVEDSVLGVAAARAALMPVVGFCGGSHCRPGHAEILLKAGCRHVFADIAELANCLADTAIGSSTPPCA
jgi:HAD superfamily hydrolase (TIGR01509 family)